MLLKELIEKIFLGDVDPRWLETDITDICSDSRQVTPGSLFVALKGTSKDGRDFIQEALDRGAVVVVKGADIGDIRNFSGYLLRAEDPRRVLQELLQRFYHDPSQHIKTIGVTGTNGKTTVTYLLESVFQAAKKNCGVIGTINYRYGGKTFLAKNTTPGLVDNYKLLARMVEQGIDYCVMEVSSHALDQKRVDGIDFYAAIFTNLTSDHLDYHTTQEDYFLAKTKLFLGLSPDKTAVVNVDDPRGRRLLEMVTCPVVTYGIHNRADIRAHNISSDLDGLQFSIKYKQGDLKIQSALIGLHNVYNILAVVGTCLYADISPAAIQAGITMLRNVPGRLEAIGNDKDLKVFVDYAHTEDALRNSLSSLRHLTQGRIILVFGCGGDRDKTKRPKMGEAACHLADYCIITNDNPRSENPQDIANEIVAGFDKKDFRVLLDRQKAILEALKMATPQDVVLIAGKGHEDYQIFKDRTITFDERAVVKQLLGSF